MVASILVVAGWVAGCGGSGGGSKLEKPAFVMPPPVAPCSLLTAREVSGVLDVRVRVKSSGFFCIFQGMRDHVFRAVVVTPQRLTTARPVPFVASDGRIVEVAGPGYRGQAQNDPSTVGAAGLEQSKAQIVSGDVVVRLLVSYHSLGLRGVPQLREVATLADRAGRRLARARARERSGLAGGDDGPDRLAAYRLCDRGAARRLINCTP